MSVPRSSRYLLLVVVVAALVGMAIALPEPVPASKQTFDGFISQLERGQVHSVVLHTKDNAIEVRLRNGTTYETAYVPAAADRLDRQLQEARRSGAIAGYDVEPDKSGG